jgi:signal transduction histidine kinase
MSEIHNFSGTSVSEDDIETLDSMGLLQADDDTLRPGDKFEAVMPVLRTLDEAREAQSSSYCSGGVGDDPPDGADNQTRPKADELVSLVAHDLRGPLSQASGWLALARADGDEAAFDGVEDAHQRLAERIEDFVRLAGSGMDSVAIESVSLAETANTVWAELVNDTITEMGTLVVESDRSILAVRDRLERLLANLFKNSLVHGRRVEESAIKAMSGHGWPEASAETNSVALQPLTVRVGRLSSGFYVEDDGVGVPVEDREQVFEPGYSTEDGAGLGLASVAQVAATHGWDVSVSEGTAGGARFEFSFVVVPG